MKKLFAVIKREYVQRVRTKFFVIATILGPIMMSAFTVVPGMMMMIRSGGPTRIAVVDQTGKIYGALAKDLESGDRPRRRPSPTDAVKPPAGPGASQEQMKQAGQMTPTNFTLQEVPAANRSLSDLKTELESKIQTHEIDAYLILPPDLLTDGRPEYRARNSADLFTKENVQSALGRVVKSRRLLEAGIKEDQIERASVPVDLKSVGDAGQESSGEAGFFLSLGMGIWIYMSVLLYGQLVLGAVIEEKETRIAEVLFSSIRSFYLMLGKLIGVSLVALTQMSIWALAFIVLSTWALGRGIPVPRVAPIVFVYLLAFFLMGFFIYSTVYAVVGSMVTTTQEGGQVAMPVVLLLIAGFFVSFNIIRNPSSPLAFWASMFPFFAPITMLVRIVTEMPPLWQILLSLLIGFGSATGLIWLASRIYRVGMLMYGKKATIPEVMRWVRQS
jgi:ABC-2 type transport system permease protein